MLCYIFRTTKWTSYLCTYISPLSWSPCHSLPCSTPRGHHKALSWVPCASSFPLATSFPRYCICVNATLPVYPTFPFPTVSTSPFSTSGLYTYPANRFICTIFPHMCIDIQDIFFSFWLTSFCLTDSHKKFTLGTNSLCRSYPRRGINFKLLCLFDWNSVYNLIESKFSSV